MKLSKTKLKQIIKEELEGSSRDDAISSLKDLADVFDKIDQAGQSGGAEWKHVPGEIVSAANSSAAWMTMAEDIEDEYYDELQHAIKMLEDKEGTNPHGSRTVEYARDIGHPMADKLDAAMKTARRKALPYMKSLVGSGSGMMENKMKLSKAKLQQIILEEIERVEQEDLILEGLSELIDLQAKQMGIVLTEQEKKDYLQKALKKLKKYGFGVGVGAALAAGGAGLHSAQSGYAQDLRDRAAQNVAAAELRAQDPAVIESRILKQLKNEYAWIWNTSGDKDDKTPFPAVQRQSDGTYAPWRGLKRQDDGSYIEVGGTGAADWKVIMLKGDSVQAVYPPDWSVMQQVYMDFKSGTGPRVRPEDAVPATGQTDVTDFFNSEVWKQGDIKSTSHGAPYRGSKFVSFDSLPENYQLPLSGKSPSEYYVQMWDKYVGY